MNENEEREDEPQAEVKLTEIAPITYTAAAVVLDPIEEILVGLEEKHKDVVYDLTTTKGDKEARASRSELVKTRTGAAKAYKLWNAPIKDEQELARKRVADITTRVLALEEPLDAQIKADEGRREVARLERERAERERIATIRSRIDTLVSLPLLAVDMDSEDIAAVIDDVALAEITEERFGEFVQEAREASASTATKLQAMHASAQSREAMAKQLLQQQEDIARQRRELEEQAEKLKLDQEAQAERNRQSEILRQETDRHAADKAARDADDARHAASCQADAFPVERREAIDVIEAAPKPEPRRAHYASRYSQPLPDKDQQCDPVTASESSGIQGNESIDASFDDANHAAAIASSEERSESVETYHMGDAEEWAPDAAFIIDAVASATQEHSIEKVLSWLRAVDWNLIRSEDFPQ